MNKESAARLAKQKADKAAADAEASQDDGGGGADRGPAEVQRPASRARPADRRTRRGAGQTRAGPAASAPATGTGRGPPGVDPPRPTPAATGTARPGRPPAGGTGPRQWDPTLPPIPAHSSAAIPIAIINTVLGIASTSAQVTQDMGRSFLQKLGLLPTPTGYTNGAIPAGLRPAGHPSTSSAAPCRRWACRTRGAAATRPGRATASTPARAQSDSTARA